jgi:hypothetical protein
LKQFSRRQSSGFVLVACIWVIAAMVVFVGFVATSAEQTQAMVLRETSQLAFTLDKRATESTFIYLGATRGVSYAGLKTKVAQWVVKEDEFNPFSGNVFAITGDEFRLDGRVYQGIGGLEFGVQDTGALVGLRVDSGFPTDKLEKLLLSYGVSRDEARRLLGALIDYVDHDDFPTVDGAERKAYLRQGEMGPTNRFLVNPGQLRNVLGWEQALGNEFDGFLEEVTVGAGGRNNFNSLTTKGMRLLALDANAISRIQEYRSEQAFTSLFEVNEVAGTLIDDGQLAISFIPDTFYRIRLWNPSSRHEEWIGVRFTPVSGFAPWQIDYRLTRQRDLAALGAGVNENNASLDPQTPPTPLLQ